MINHNVLQVLDVTPKKKHLSASYFPTFRFDIWTLPKLNAKDNPNVCVCCFVCLCVLQRNCPSAFLYLTVKSRKMWWVSDWLCLPEIFHNYTLFIHTSACSVMSTVKPHRKSKELRGNTKCGVINLTVDWEIVYGLNVLLQLFLILIFIFAPSLGHQLNLSDLCWWSVGFWTVWHRLWRYTPLK